MFRFLVLKPLVFDECLVSWFQTPFLQILRVRLGFAVNCSAPFCSFLMNVSSPGADFGFLPFGSVLRFDECLGSWPPFCRFLMNVSVPGANSALFLRATRDPQLEVRGWVGGCGIAPVGR